MGAKEPKDDTEATVADQDASPGADDGSSGGAGSQDSITDGGLVRPLFKLAWPIVAIQLLQVTYNIADTLYLGRLSAEAVGALSLSFPLIFLLISVAGGFTAAGAILVAQHTGAEGDHTAGRVAGQTVAVVSALSVVIGVGGYAYTRPALRLLPSDPQTLTSVVPLAADYMEIIFLGMPLLFGFFVFAAVMRGHGDTRTPMFVMVASVLVNVIADPFFIFGFQGNPLLGLLGLESLEVALLSATGYTGWGIEGAAVATIIARGVGTVIGLGLLFRTDLGPDISVAQLLPDREIIEDIVRLGTPSMIEQSTSALALIALTAIVVTFTPEVVAAYGLGNRLVSLVFLPVLGLGRAIDTMVGQNLGAERGDRAERATWLAVSTGAGVMLLVAIGTVAFTGTIVGLFLGDVPDAPATIALGVEYIRIRSVEFAFIGITQVILGAFRGAGNTKIAMTISILTLWVGRVGTSVLLVFGLGWGPTGLWVGMAVGNVLGAVVGVVWFTRGTWKSRYIDGNTDSTAQTDGVSVPANSTAGGNSPGED
jgi:putative efflux protein, MATE family